jgi:hypothetical protein
MDSVLYISNSMHGKWRGEKCVVARLKRTTFDSCLNGCSLQDIRTFGAVTMAGKSVGLVVVSGARLSCHVRISLR